MNKTEGKMYGSINGAFNDWNNSEATKKIHLEFLEIEIENRKQDKGMRSEYANKIFVLVCVYLVVVGALLIESGRTFNDFYLSENILITLLGTTTANVLILLYFVAKYLFSK